MFQELVWAIFGVALFFLIGVPLVISGFALFVNEENGLGGALIGLVLTVLGVVSAWFGYWIIPTPGAS